MNNRQTMRRWQALSVALVTTVPCGVFSPPSFAQQICYRDESGRIIQRRVPGAVEVPCPSAEPGDEPAVAPGQPPVERPAAEESRRRGLEPEAPQIEPRQRNPVSPIPRPTLEDYVGAVPVPDRWRIVDSLGYDDRFFDPYNRNVLKADKPVFRDDWFFNLGIISDTVYEAREVVTPVGSSETQSAGDLDVFGGSDQWTGIENLAVELVYYKGDTVFKPPDLEFRFVPVFNYNYTEIDEVLGLNIDPRLGRTRTDSQIGIQGLFVDKHLRNVGDRYDFDSFRFGIQPFSSDFRGFLFQDNQLGLRFFGTRNNNRLQYNLGVFRRIEKDTNSGLNDVSEPLRDDDVFVFNVYRQDTPVLGFTSQATVLFNRNREEEVYLDKNGFIQRPAALGLQRLRNYDVTYLGYNGDGHFGPWNLTASVYGAFGDEDRGPFREGATDIEASFAAFELSRDFNWARGRISFLYGSGDEDPFDDESTGFDAVFENPQFAGADTSYWIRQAVPLIGGGRVTLSTRNGVLNSLRSSKDEGQSNFTNPGIWLFGVGADFDLSPMLRVSVNWNALEFDDTTVVEVARNQGPIDKDIGQDVSVGVTYRPRMTQNVVIRASYARLLTGDGFEDLFPEEDPGYFLLNVVLAY
jgi:hypothetical protein